jgi:formylmethanofuran dehydrogenase subunit E
MADDPHAIDTVADGSPWYADAPRCCERCDEEDISPNVEAYEISGECVCDVCAEAIFAEQDW